MRPTRREFLWTMGAVGAAAAVQETRDVFWTDQPEVDLGWAPGIESHLSSTCLVCPSRCGISGRLVDGHLVRITGNPLHPLSRGGVCPRGIAGVQMLYHPKRLASPLVRTGARGAGEWQQVSTEDAVTRVVERLGEIRAGGRPEALALLAGYCAGSMESTWRQFLGAFGSPNYIADDYRDGTEAVMQLMHGIARRPSYDLDQTRFVLSFGAPLFESWWSPLQAFVAFADPARPDQTRPRFVQVDTRFSRTAARAQEWVGIRPGTHAVLALGMAYVIVRDELFDADFVARHVSGFEDSVDTRGDAREGYRSLVLRHYRTEEVSATTGVPVERITALARSFAQSPRALAICGPDVTLAENGLLAGMAVHSLNVLTGNINRPGGVLFGDDPPLDALVRPVLDETSRGGTQRDPVGGPPPTLFDGNRPSRFAEAVVGGDGSPVDALLLYYANPLASSIHQDTWRAALARIPFVVSFSPFLDETTRHADLVLPDLLPYERWQDAPTPASYPYPVWGVARPLVQPEQGGMATGDAVLAIAHQLGGAVSQSLPYDDFETLLQVRARGLFAARRGMAFGDEFERRHHRQMEERGWWLPAHTEFEPFWQELVQRGGWVDFFYDHSDPARRAATPSGRIELFPAEIEQALRGQGGTRRVYLDVTPVEGDADDDFPLRLLPYRLSTLSSGTVDLERWLAERPALFPEVLWEPWVEVSPETAQTSGLSDGSMVWVVSQRGRYRARVKIFPGTAPENVCAPYGLRHPDGEMASPLQILDGSVDDLTGLPSWNSTRVRLEHA